MNNYSLRNHIPIAGPATREPIVGDESDLRLSIGFTPNWFHQKLNIDFGEVWHTDPQYRYDTLFTMKKYLHELFPSIDNFTPKFEDGIERSCATISGAFGAVFVAKIYGMQIRYFNNNWPTVDTSAHFSKEELMKLKPFDLENNRAMIELMKQMDYIEENFGKIHGYVNWQGILNNAMRLYGEDLFVDMYEDEGFVDFLLNHVYETMLNAVKIVQKRQNDSGFDINLLSLSNCVMNMISPRMYEKFVRPYDIKMSKHFDRFGIHTCNWNINPYVNSLKEIEKLGYIDMGFESDLKGAREAFNQGRRAVLYSPVFIAQKSIEDIKKDFQRIYDELSPCDLVLADIEHGVDTSKVQKIIQIAEEIASV